MLVAHEERFQRIYTDYRDRPSGDYAELLRRGEVMSREGVNLVLAPLTADVPAPCLGVDDLLGVGGY
jgi:hypothetical protein